ncbi:MAG: Hsp20/alpha crystallin family protein [Prochlorothrix sp.]|nr:Hsp20/alpha crystallin family protein [Prochlorothrix sp.]
MTVIRYRPFFDIDTELRTLQGEMNRLFGAINPLDDASFVPRAELSETQEHFQIRFELPGMSKEDLNVEVTPDSVRISGHRQEVTPADEALNHRSEFRYGAFERVIGLPAEVKHNETKATYENGILALTLPKRVAEDNAVHKVTF